MNTDLLTFFSAPGSADETIRALTVELGDYPEIEILIYGRERVDLSQTAQQTVTTDEEYKSLIRSLKAALSRGGGLLAELQPHNGFTRVALTLIQAQGFKPPRQMLRINSSSPAKFEEMQESPDDIALGDHLVIPVSADAENRLQAFYEQLKGFPADLESSILNVIRRPSLEWRIERIERSLSLPQATLASQQSGQPRRETIWEKLLRTFMWRVPVGPVVASALLLTAGSLAAYNQLHRRSEPENSQVTQPNQPTSTPLVSTQRPASSSKPATSATLASSLNDLKGALEASQNSALQSLYQSHLKDNWDQRNKSAPFFWGIAKLGALRLKLIEEADPMLRDVNAQTSAKAVLRGDDSLKALEGDAKTLNLFLWSCCERSSKPELPQTANDPSPVTLPTTRTCDAITSEDAIASLDELTAWVRAQPSGTAK